VSGRPELTHDGCSYSSGLLALPQAPRPFYDNGIRDIPGVRFESMESLGDVAIPGCAGRRIVMVFSVEQPRVYTDPIEIGTVNVATLGSPPADPVGCEEPDCKCLTAKLVKVSPTCKGCGADHKVGACRRQNRPARRRTRRASRGGYRQPFSFQTLSLLTPPMPESITTVPIFDLQNGLGAVCNLRLAVHDAIPGIADPMTPEGHSIYCSQPPVTELLIPRLDANERLVFDGRSGDAHILCPDGRCVSALPSVSLSGGSWACSRKWISLQISCDERSRGNEDLSFTAFMAAEFIT